RVKIHLFFFQAEDGIRDFHVTGVQTCALPIWFRERPETEYIFCIGRKEVRHRLSVPPSVLFAGSGEPPVPPRSLLVRLLLQLSEIGRASCRERVEMGGVGGALNNSARIRDGET